MNAMPETELLGDAELVQLCLAGDRDAFGHIVARYQSLVCALAYSACGDLARSEDMAQETFLAAWRQLAALKEPARLKAWLCGIARNRINSAFREQTRNPLAAAEPLEESGACAEVPAPPDHVISQEEEAILWRVLEGMPRSYRDPMILFYRQNESVAEVADGLGLSEEAVRQRLSRGRAMLNERVAKFVEAALHQSAPTRAFTLGVMAALPGWAGSASAATVGAAAAKGSATAKAASLAGIFIAILTPLLAALGIYFGYKLNLEEARSRQEREFIRKLYRVILKGIAGFGLAMVPIIIWGDSLAKSHPGLFAGWMIGMLVAYVAVLLLSLRWVRRQQRALHAGEPAQPLAATEAGKRAVPEFEYRSKLSLLGWPLVHIRVGCKMGPGDKPVKAWIAVGDRAIGLVALGGWAIGAISLGGFSFGLLTVGGFAVGLLPFGGFSFGPWAIGGQAMGILAYGGCAIGWSAAQGGVALARDFAVGGVALARHANDAAAAEFFDRSIFFQYALASMQYAVWLNVLWLLPLVLLWRKRRQQRGGTR